MTNLLSIIRRLDLRNNLNRSLREFYSIYCHFQRHAELNRLIVWAERKRLSRIARYYRWLRDQNEQRISRAGICFPRLCSYADIASTIYQQAFQPKAWRKGAGEVYRLRKRSLIRTG